MTFFDLLRVIFVLPETVDKLTEETKQMAVDLTKLRSDVDALKTETTAALARVAADIKTLQDQIAAGSGVTQADIDGLATGVEGVLTSLRGLDPLPNSP
jgi:uncharacterized protein YoxC